MKSEIHLFILWENARYQQEKILADMACRFTILKKFAITWTPDLVSSNFTRFYGQNLPRNSFKERECGTGEFLLCVVRDDEPIYQERNTSHGPEMVNVSMFDAKTMYRDWTGGGHKIHCTTNTKETNHDLTLLLGKNATDLMTSEWLLSDEDIIVLQKDLEGAEGWDTIEHLFYVLNNSVRYAAMRGMELMTDEYNNMCLIVGDTTYCLNLWDCGRTGKDYFDPHWVKEMLDTTTEQDGIKILSAENDFYCLLYHGLIHQENLAEEYVPKLNQYRAQLGITKTDWNEILVDFLTKKNYDIVRHKDPSVPLHISNPIINKYALRWGGICIQSRLMTYPSLEWSTRVYEKTDSFVKKGSPWMINDEKKALVELSGSGYFPSVIGEGRDRGEEYIEITRVPGISSIDYLTDFKHRSVRDIVSFIRQGLDILLLLQRYKLIHRDFIGDNILVDVSSRRPALHVIDFGWVIPANGYENCRKPSGLGLQYAADDKYSDFITFSKYLLENYGCIKWFRKALLELQRIGYDEYGDDDLVLEVYRHVNAALDTCIDAKSLYKFYRRRLGY